MADEQPIHPGSFVGDTVEEFKKLPTWGKIAIGVGLVAVVGLAIYLRSHASSSTSGVTSGISSGSSGLSTGTGSTDLSGGTAAGAIGTPSSGDTSGSSSSGSTSTSTPLNVFQNLLSGTNGKGLLGKGATVYSAGGQIYATQPGGITALLSSILPAGTKIWQGGQGRWWYALPGEHTQYLLTAGAGPDQSKQIGIKQSKIPSGALTVTAPSATNTTSIKPLQQGQLPTTH